MLELLKDAGEIVERTLEDLAVRFGRTFAEADREDIAQEAYRKILEAKRRGVEVRAPLAMVKKAARNVALDRLNLSARSDEPYMDSAFVGVGAGMDPESVVLTRADLARGIEAAEQLPRDQQAVYRAAVIDGLSPQEACRLLSISRTTFFKYRKLAISYVQSAQLNENGLFDRGEYKLLSSYALGVASARERARVRRLLRHDPRAAALLRELRRGHEIAAVGLPTLALHEVAAEPTTGVLERVGAVPGKIRDAVYGFARPETAEAASGPLASGLGGATGQIAAVCGGVATAACVAAIAPGGGGLVRAVGDEETRPAVERSAEAKEPRPAARATPAIAVYPSQVGNEASPVATAPAPAEASAPADGAGADPAPEAPPSEPVQAEEARSSDFTYGTPSPSPAPAPTTPETSSSSSGSEDASSGGGGSAAQGGDFTFGQ